jgi:hypothetical protein
MPVYFIRAGDTGPVKIGWADDVEARRKQLQVSNHALLRIIRTIECGRQAEGWMHEYFAARRLEGEWFQFDTEMLVIEPPDLGPPKANWRARKAAWRAKKATMRPVSWAADRCTIQRPCTQCLGLLPGLNPEYLYWTTPRPHRRGLGLAEAAE